MKPLFVKYGMFSLKVSIVDAPFKYITGVDRIRFYYQLYSTKISMFPSIGLIGDFLVKSTYMVPFFGLVSRGMQIGDYLYLL